MQTDSEDHHMKQKSVDAYEIEIQGTECFAAKNTLGVMYGNTLLQWLFTLWPGG